MKNKIHLLKKLVIFLRKTEYISSVKVTDFLFCKNFKKNLKKVLTLVLNDSIIWKFQREDGTKYIEK